MEFIKITDALFKVNNELNSIDANKLCHFGIKPLDDARPFILKDDLIVIGADSGVGKTELVLHIAKHNALNGKRVALFALEGGDKAAAYRLLFKETISELEKKFGHRVNIDYVKWAVGSCNDDNFKEAQKIAINNFKDIESNFWIYEVTKGFTVQHLIDSLKGFSSLEDVVFGEKDSIELDLIIVDHLQYFDIGNSKSENHETTNILKEIKHITEFYGVPVIMVSHLRKKDKDRGLAGQEHFHGSSNIVKISSEAITITPDKEKQDHCDGLYPTYIRFAKSRVGLRDSYAIKVDFNVNKREYEDKYTMVGLSSSGFICDEIKYNKAPIWAREGGLKREEKNNLGFAKFKERNI